MGQSWLGMVRRLCAVVAVVALALALVAGAGCRVVDLRNPWKVYYDPNEGTEKEEILANFNLHRGRWWNYYMRGSCLLAYEHYKAARDDFAEAMDRRSEDKRDARIYGMHFIDYFPNREFGIALHLEAMSRRDPNDLKWPAVDPNTERKLYADAVDSLEASLRQTDSSRAKFYLNQARRELLRQTEDDSEGPIIWVKKPIHTNRRTVRFDVTAMDVQSCVAEIHVDESHGRLEIDRSRYLVELAEKVVTKTVEVTLKPGKRIAVVKIWAVDLVGNASDPTKALIILDTMTPLARFAVDTGKTRRGARVSVVVMAQDDFGLKHIQLGEDENDALDCDGAFVRSATISAMPRDGELAVTVVDCAGNTLEGYIPVTDHAGRESVAQAPWPPAPRTFPPADHVAASNWDWPPLPALSSDSYAHLPLVSVHPGRGASRPMVLLASSHEPAIREMPKRGEGAFYFPPQLCQEASSSSRVVPTWNLTSREVYQILLLLFFSEYSGDLPAWPAQDRTREDVYWATRQSLEDLRFYSESSRRWTRRFGIHDVNTVSGEPLREVWDMPEDEIVQKLRNWQRGTRSGASVGQDEDDHTLIDLVLYGELTVRKERDKETFEITLRARDVERRKDLSFPDRWGETEVLADIHGTVGDLNPYIDLLASKVLERFPRCQGQVSFTRRHWYSLLRSDVRIDVGERHRMFEGMKLHFFDQIKKKICAGEIIRVDYDSSLVKPKRGHELPRKNGIMAITE